MRLSSITVLVISDVLNEDGDAWPEAVRAQLVRTSSFAGVDLLQLSATSSLPTLDSLQRYQAVVVFVEHYHAGLANLTVDYGQGGGAVIETE